MVDKPSFWKPCACCTPFFLIQRIRYAGNLDQPYQIEVIYGEIERCSWPSFSTPRGVPLPFTRLLLWAARSRGHWGMFLKLCNRPSTISACLEGWVVIEKKQEKISPSGRVFFWRFHCCWIRWEGHLIQSVPFILLFTCRSTVRDLNCCMQAVL